MTKKVLIVVHQEHSTPGKVGQFIVDSGYALDRFCPCLGDKLPDNVDEYTGIVVFGGPQSANDDHDPGIRAELDWLEHTALPSAKPVLGICLGAQEIARVLGAKVGPHPDGLVEIGYVDIHPTGEDAAFMSQTTTFYQWHSETFEIPSDAVHLAENENFPGQAFRYGEHTHAIEFHPEMTLEMIDKWCSSERGSKKLVLPGAQAHADQIVGYDRHAEGSDFWLHEFLSEHLLVNA